MKVIGAGLPRTGTLSTRAALEQLLGPCYHGATPMVEKPEHMQFWVEALDQEHLDPEKTKELLAEYEGGVDLPFIGWYKELLGLYPEAKVLLTVRDPKRWYKSASFIYYIIGTLNFHQPYAWFMTMVGLGKWSSFMQQECGGIETGRGIFPNGVNGKQNRALNKGEEAAVEFFNQHTEEVKSFVPESQLLIFNVRDGWEPLCEFLDVPVPDTPFPHINDANEVRVVFNSVKALTWVTILGVPALLVYALSYLPTAFLPLGVLGTFGILWAAGRMVSKLVKNQTDKSKQH